MLRSISTTLAGPPTFPEEWRRAVDAWRGPPSFGEQWRQAIDTLRGPPSAFQQLRELTKRMHEGADIQVHAHAPPKRVPAPTARRGRPPYDWPRITRLDAENYRTHVADNNRAPTWKQRWQALRDVLGSKTPHIETLKKKLPRIPLP